MPRPHSLRNPQSLCIAFALFFLAVIIRIPAQIRGLEVIAAPITDTTPGRQYAVLIAVEQYREWFPLRFPVRDAQKIAAVLQERYWITDTIEIYNTDATKAGILRRLDALAQNLQPDDSVLIYYAGHGYLDPASGLGFWIPQDAGIDNYAQENWLPNAQIRALIARMRARHIVLISDSCFSGDILNTTRSPVPTITDDYFRKAYARRSRQVLTSGSSENVPDPSEFTRALIRTLEDNRKPYLDPLMLFGEIRLAGLSTTPLLGTLSMSDHQDGGSFILFLKDVQSAKPVQTVQQPPVAAVQPTVQEARTNTGRFLLPTSLPDLGLQIDGTIVKLQRAAGSEGFESPPLAAGSYVVKVTGSYPYESKLTINPEQWTVLEEWRKQALSQATQKREDAGLLLSSRKAQRSVGFGSITLGILGTGAAVTAWALGNIALDAYDAAETSQALADARQQVELLRGIFVGSAVTGGLGFLAAPLFLSGSNPAALEASIQRLDEEIRALGSQ